MLSIYCIYACEKGAIKQLKDIKAEMRKTQEVEFLDVEQNYMTKQKRFSP
jgi:hypothetical protein